LQGPTLISLFTGAGGLDIGLEAAGFRTLVATDVEPYAMETLRRNQELIGLAPAEFEPWFQRQLTQRCYENASRSEVSRLRARLRKARKARAYLCDAHLLEGDIRAITSDKILSATKKARGRIDLIAGGPPCQPFSRAGNRETIACDTGRLFKEFVRIVDDLRPRFFLFENVKGLAQTKTPVVRLTCANCGGTSLAPFDVQVGNSESKAPCSKCSSFDVQYETKNESGGSLEIIVNEFEGIGYKCYSKVLNAVNFGAPQFRERLFIVGSRDGEFFEWPKPLYCRPVGNDPSDQLDLFSTGESRLAPWKTLFEALWKRGHPEYGPLDKSKAVLWVKNVVRPHDEPVTWTVDRPSPTVGAHQAAKLAIAPYGVPPEQLERQQWHIRGARQGDSGPIFVEHAYLSDLELLQLQTFPSSWYLFGTRMQRAFQIGNAVPPALAQVIGREIAKIIAEDYEIIGKAKRNNRRRTTSA
jgi:DNA (cytosine-5)-methyltransferase 1